VVCNLNERTQNVFDPASVSTRRRRKIAEKEEENEERPAESSEMDLDTTRSHIRPKQVLYTGRSPWWPINQQDLGSQQHRVVELFSLRARPPFLLFSCFFFPAASVPRNLYATPRKFPPGYVYIRHPAPRASVFAIPTSPPTRFREASSRQVRRFSQPPFFSKFLRNFRFVAAEADKFRGSFVEFILAVAWER
jgi:hypothetical protein